jgi:hypothetical protein
MCDNGKTAELRSPPISDQKSDEFRQMFGSQFAPTMASLEHSTGSEENKDLQRVISVNSTISNETPHKSPAEPSTDKKQEESPASIQRITEEVRTTKVAKRMGRHNHKQKLPANHSDAMQRWKSQRTHEEPWMNIGQVQMCEARSESNGGIVSGQAESNAATKGSFEADELR